MIKFSARGGRPPPLAALLFGPLLSGYGGVDHPPMGLVCFWAKP